MADRAPPVSSLITTVRARDAERAELDAKLQAFLATPGNAIEHLGDTTTPTPQPTYRELGARMATARVATVAKREAARKRARADEEE